MSLSTQTGLDLKGAAKMKNILDKLDPFDLQYLYRFSCGINSKAGSKIIEYLKRREDGDKFAILCILEQTGKVDDIKETIRDLCSNQKSYAPQSKLLQRSTIQLLEIAAKYDIPISRVWLNSCSPRVSESGLTPQSGLILQSGLSVSILTSLQQLMISDYPGRSLTTEEFVAILGYCSQCTSLKDLQFDGYHLPETIPTGRIPSALISRNVKVWNHKPIGRYRRLNLLASRLQDCDGDGNLLDDEKQIPI